MNGLIKVSSDLLVFFYTFGALKWIRLNTALFLVLTFSIGLVYQTITVVHFYCNREAIIQEFCVNKDRPQMNCHGKCHLEKQLTRAVKVDTKSDSVSPEPLSFWLYGVEVIKPFEVGSLTFLRATESGYHRIAPSGVKSIRFVPPDLLS